MKNIRFYTIAVLFDKQLTPKVNRCLHMDIRYSTFDIGSHVISCLRECRLLSIDIINNRLGIERLDSQILCSRITRLLAWKEKDLVTRRNNIKKSCACASFFPLRVRCIYRTNIWSLVVYKCKSSVRNLKIEIIK